MTVNKVRNELKCHSVFATLYAHMSQVWAWQPWKGLSDAKQQPSARTQIGNACHILHLSALIHGFFIFIHTQADRTYFINYLSQLIALCVRVCPVQGTGYRIWQKKKNKMGKSHMNSVPQKGKLFPIHLQHIFSSFCKTLSPLNVRRVGGNSTLSIPLPLTVCLLSVSLSLPSWLGRNKRMRPADK